MIGAVNSSYLPFSSSLTDTEWEILKPLLLEVLPLKKQIKPLSWS